MKNIFHVKQHKQKCGSITNNKDSTQIKLNVKLQDNNPLSPLPIDTPVFTYIFNIHRVHMKGNILRNGFPNVFCTSTNASSYLSRLSGKQTFPVSWAEEK